MADIEKSMNCGIYQIQNKVNGRVYIGSSNNIARRFYLHKWELSRGDHHSTTLQRSWNKYGENVFEFTTLLICAEADLFMYEQGIIDFVQPYDPLVGFNICSDVRGTRGVKWTEEQRIKTIATKTGKPIYKNNPEAYERLMKAVRRGGDHQFYGKQHTEESKKKISENRKGKPAWNKGITSSLKGIKRGPSGYKHTPEAIARIAEASRNRSATTKLKISIASRNRSEETLAKLSAATTAYWQRKRTTS